MRLIELLAALLLFLTTAAAGPSPWDSLGYDIAPLLKRQAQDKQQSTSDNTDNTANTDNTKDTTNSDNTASTDTTKTDTTSNTNTDNTNNNNNTTDVNTSDNNNNNTDNNNNNTDNNNNNNTDNNNNNNNQKGDSTKGKNGDEKKPTKTFDARLPAGGVSMITPNPQTTQYYKIHDFITFAWNYTSLSVTPSAIDILASCSLNQQTYTIALNHSVEATQTVVWDTGEYQATATVPLLTETYTLIIHDATKDVTDRPQAGYLGTYNQFTFGMYTPQPYTPMADYVCATCNAAMSALEKQTTGAVFAMVGLTVLSFSWFTGVAGLW